MRQFIRAAVIGAFIAGFCPAAQADTFVWKDDTYDYTVSFPDSWSVQTSDLPATRLRVAGPLREDMPTCRLQVQEDGRLKIYPKRLMDEAVAETLNEEFWAGETGQYKDAQITAFYSPASLGDKGDATAIQVAFKQDDGTGKMVPMHGVMIGSIYGDKRYVGSCSSRAEVYSRWAGLFMSILDSVQLESKYHPFPTGYYRNFLTDPKLALPRVKPGAMTSKNKIVPGRDFFYND